MQTGKAQGGKNVYGAAIGIIMLESQFPRIYGDAGNAATWPFPVLFKVVTDASPEHARRLTMRPGRHPGDSACLNGTPQRPRQAGPHIHEQGPGGLAAEECQLRHFAKRRA